MTRAERIRSWLTDTGRLLYLSVRLVAGRRFWIVPLLPLTWLGFQAFRIFIGWRPTDYGPADAQSILIGFPLAVLAIGLGVRIIAGEIDRRTLEIAYTVPGGARRVWISKLIGAALLLAASELLMVLITWFFFTDFPWDTVYGAFQAAFFYLVLAMSLSAVTRSEAAGALLSVVVLLINFPVQAAQLRISPFWNVEALASADPADVAAWTVQNRIGFVLAIAAIAALAFTRAERREKLLGG